MGMVVRTNTMGINANRQLGMNNSAVAKSLEKLSSGFRINRAGDDASGLAISEKMKAQIKGLEQASTNAQDAISLIQTAEGATTEIHNMLNRMVELCTKAANGTYESSTDRPAIQAELDQLCAEMDRIAGNTNFNGITLLDGNLADLNLQVGATSAEAVTLTISQSLKAADLGVDKANLGDIGADADGSVAKGAIQTIKDAINDVSTVRGTLGAMQNRLEYTINNLDTTAENMTAANSRIRDTDMAKEMMNYTKMNVLTQAAQAMLAQANQQPQSVLQLLQ